MRVLLFSAYFWPEETGPAPYVTEPARFLVRQGHSVDVWTGFAHYPAWSPMQRRKIANHEIVDGISIHRRFHFIPRAQTAAHRARYEGSLLLGAVSALQRRHRPDVVLGVTPTLSGAAAAAFAGRRFRVPFAVLVHDLMGRAAEQSGVGGGAGVAAAVRRIEVSAARRAARVGIIADGFRSYFASAGIPDERIIRLRTWTLGTGPTRPRDRIRDSLGWNESDFVVLHGGNIGQKQALDNLVDAAVILRGDPHVRVVIAGDGNDRPRLERRARALALPNLQVLPPQPWGDFEAMLEAADVLVVNQRASVEDMSLPSKLTSYFAAGRPVIAAVAHRSETAEEVRRSGGGMTVEAEDPQALADLVRYLRDRPDLAETLGWRARQYADNNLAASAALPEYENFLTGLCA